jgi:hypothetical protein
MVAKTAISIWLITLSALVLPLRGQAIPSNGWQQLLASSAAGETPHAFARSLQIELQDKAEQERSAALAFGLSLLLPGAGQAYNGDYWRTALYGGIEILAIAMAVNYNAKGDDVDAQLRSFADQHWDEVVYWAKVYQLGVRNGKYDDLGLGWDINEAAPAGSLPSWVEVGFKDLYPDDPGLQRALREIETTVETYFTHTLPEKKTQQYYEMIGKYTRQFGNAWSDADFNYLYNAYAGESTALNRQYYDMRNESNGYYDMATNWLSVLLINHLVSSIDAVISARNYNRSLALRYQPRFRDGYLINTYALELSF